VAEREPKENTALPGKARVRIRRPKIGKLACQAQGVRIFQSARGLESPSHEETLEISKRYPGGVFHKAGFTCRKIKRSTDCDVAYKNYPLIIKALHLNNFN